MGEMRDSKVMDLISLDPHVVLSLNNYPNEKSIRAIYNYLQIVIAVYQYSIDIEGIDLLETIQEKVPKREDFSSDEDYNMALSAYEYLRRVLNAYSKYQVKLNLNDLDTLHVWRIPFEATIAALNGIRGHRFNVLTTERIHQISSNQMRNKGGLLSFLGGERREENEN